MKNILAEAQREVIEQFAWSNALLALDYDGTLASIVEDPADAVMRKSTRKLLEQAAVLYPTVVISGRAQSDVAKRLRGANVCSVVGNHGLEPWRGTDTLVVRVREAMQTLRSQLATVDGVIVEDKKFSLAIHYRRSRQKKKARDAIQRAVAQLDRVRIIGGKQVVNVLPEGAPHKGIALERERARAGCDTAIYVGDDETDEDVFDLDQPGRLLTIRVGAKHESAATYCIPRQAAIDDLLRAFIEPRRRLRQHRRASR